MITDKKSLIYFLLLISLVSCGTSQKNKEIKFRCNSERIEPKPIPIPENYSVPIPKSIKKKRALEPEEFKDFNIYLDLLNFEQEAQEYGIPNDIKEMFSQGMKKAVKTLSSLLRVKKLNTNYKIPDEQIKLFKIKKWNETNIGTNAEKGILEVGIDLFIFVRFDSSSELGQYTLASAGARYFDDQTGQPIIGVANINKDIDYTIPNSLQYFQATILHEFIHILGFANTFFDRHHFAFNGTDSNGIKRIYLNSSKVVEVAKKYYNCESVVGVELENFGGTGTTGSHWEERILLGEIMNGVVYPEEQVISEFTLAVLEDMGYYKPNYYTGGLMQYGKHKGCDFINNKCVVNKNGEVVYKNEFFGQILYYGNIDPGCSSGRQSRAYHYLYDYEEEPIPEPFKYYSEDNLGGRQSTDYCPVSEEYYEESELRYYVGHCSNKGNGQYGTLIINTYGNNFNDNGDFSQVSGEVNSDHSFCALSSLFPKSEQNSERYSQKVHAFCYQMSCSEKSLTIQIKNDFIVCPRAGGKINAVNYNGYFLCPDYYLICSGTTLCNDLFDCVDKKSLLKEDIIYDYEIKTSQDINDAEEDNNISQDAYELSDDGKCPKFCSQCDNQGYCIKCKSDYAIVEINENEKTRRICMNITSLNKGYYKNEEIYYKCKDNCEQCSNGNNCAKCIDTHTLQDNKCFLTIDNCKLYEGEGTCQECMDGYKIKEGENICIRGYFGCKVYIAENETCSTCEDGYQLLNYYCFKEIKNCSNYNSDTGECIKCNEGFAFDGNERSTCKSKSQFGVGYYSKDNGISFYHCNDTNNEGIEHCSECNYETDKVVCTKCSSDYILLDDKTDICYFRGECNSDNRKCYQIDEYHYNTCSKGKENCFKCEKNVDENIICIECMKDFRLPTGNNTCYPVIPNCNTYDKDDSCLECISGYGFEGNDRKSCKSINYFLDYFSKDNGISYLKCDDTGYGGIQNCKTCEYNDKDNVTICTRCKTNFILKDDENKICYSKEDYKNNKEYYYEDPYHVKSCNKNMENCVECEKSSNKLQCNKCSTDYSVVHDDNKHCIKTSEINENIYYKEHDEYYSCLSHNLINNCLNCENKNVCLLCDTGYTFISDEKSECKSKEELGQRYIQDENDNTIYRECSGFMENCDTCSTKEVCLTCAGKFGLYNDKKTCINTTEQKHYLDEKDRLYYLCNIGVDKCEKCSEKKNCIKCQEGYAKLNSNNSICNLFSEINTEEYYIDPKDDNNYIKCSNYVKDCYSCEYPKGCNFCNEGFIMLNEDRQFCHEKEKTDLTGFFTNDNITYYSCRETRYKNNIQCFSLIPEQIIELTFLQVQIVNKKLFCFMITHSPLPKDFSIKLKINIYRNRLRNLEEKEIVLSTNDDSNGSSDTIVSFTSEEEYTEEENIKVKEINFNNVDSVTKTVTDNNICSLKFDSKSDLVDTKKVKTLIEQKKIPDCSTDQKTNIISLTLDKVINCEFNLHSEEKVSFSSDSLIIDLIEPNNTENIISAECKTKKEEVKTIKCNIKKDDKKEINSEYTFKDEIILDSEQFITLSSEESQFKIFCEKKESKKLLMIIIVAAVAAIIIIVVLITCIVVCKKDKKNVEGQENSIYARKGLERIPTQYIRTNRKNMTTLAKLETANNLEKEEEIEENININDYKRKKNRSKTKRHTNKSRKDKKHKSTKVTKATNNTKE